MPTLPQLAKAIKRANPRLADGTTLAAELQADLTRLGLGHLTACYVPHTNVLRITWPHRLSDAKSEGVEFIASRASVERMRPVLRAMARGRADS